tara:strand:+ start:848 stop:1159 length:312 start_codon:yes stop_codon:yes gene_type:complete
MVDGDLSEKPKTARSYRASVVGDNTVVSINIKWLGQMLVLIVGLVYSYTQITQSIANNGRRIDELEIRADKLQSLHDAEMKELAEELKWYQKNVNPFAKKKKK